MRKKIENKIDDEWVESFIRHQQQDRYNKEHVCPILRMNMLKTFYYELKTNNINSEFDQLRYMFDHVLVINRHIIHVFKKFMPKLYPNKFQDKVFPEFFRIFDDNFLSELTDKVNEEIDLIEPNCKNIFDYLYPVKNEKKFYKNICFPKNDDHLFKLKDIYIKIISTLKGIDTDDYLKDSIEYGYFIGSLIEHGMNEVKSKFKIEVKEATKKEINQYRKRFRLGMEIRAYKLSKKMGNDGIIKSFVEYDPNN